MSIGSRRTLSRQSFTESKLLPMIPHLDQEDICILEEEADLFAGKVLANTVAKLLNDFNEQRTSAKRLKWIKGIAVVMSLLALATAGLWWRATNAQHAAELATENEKKAREAAEEQTRIAESRRLSAESSSVLTQYPQRSLLFAVEAAKVSQTLRGERVAAAEQSLREAGSDDNTARLWDLSAEDPAANPVALRGHGDRVLAVAISPDNLWVLTGSWDNTARPWDLRAKDPAANPVVLRGHEGGVSAVAISPDNHWLATGSYDHTARLWDLNAKDPAASPVVLRGHEGTIRAVAISPDNRWVVTGSDDKTVGCGFFK